MNYKDYNNILFEIKDNIGYVTMNRPKAMNALNTEVLTELDDLFTKIEADDDVKIVIVTGAGRAFVGGADIAYMGALDGLKGREFAMQGQAVMDAGKAAEIMGKEEIIAEVAQQLDNEQYDHAGTSSSAAGAGVSTWMAPPRRACSLSRASRCSGSRAGVMMIRPRPASVRRMERAMSRSKGAVLS